MRASVVIQAAGGVISQQDGDGRIEVLLVHRPHRRDWTFPKGKLERGETHEACAVREVEEETGLECMLGLQLPGTAYINRKGRLKLVRYWMMYPIGGVAEPRNEVDAVQWVSLERAVSILTYQRDRKLLATFAATLARIEKAAR
jgi:8-oxo-dGTP pyrophosphatase MutT (NUDIX family)